MSQQTKLQNAELLNTQSNAGKESDSKGISSNNEQLITRTPIEGTPFWQLATERGYCAVMGNFRITEFKETETELRDEFRAGNWDMIIKLAGIVAELTYNMKMQEQSAISQQ